MHYTVRKLRRVYMFTIYSHLIIDLHAGWALLGLAIRQVKHYRIGLPKLVELLSSSRDKHRTFSSSSSAVSWHK